MEKILVDIRDGEDIIIEYFKNKDLVSVDELLDAIINLLDEKHKLEEEIEEMNKSNEPDAYEEWINKKICSE